jgi:hypothetical protein
VGILVLIFAPDAELELRQGGRPIDYNNLEYRSLQKMDSKRLQKLGLSFYAFRPEIEQLAQECFVFLVEDRGWSLLPVVQSGFSTELIYVTSDLRLGLRDCCHGGVTVWHAGRPFSHVLTPIRARP